MAQTRGDQRAGGPLDDEFSSPEENKTMQQELSNLYNNGVTGQKHDTQTDNDPSSSSMSGYDLKGMLSRVRN